MSKMDSTSALCCTGIVLCALYGIGVWYCLYNRLRLIGCLAARQHRKINLCQLGGRKPAHAAKGGKRDTMHNFILYVAQKK